MLSKYWYRGRLSTGLGGDIRGETYWFQGLPAITFTTALIYGEAALTEAAALTAAGYQKAYAASALTEAAAITAAGHLNIHGSAALTEASSSSSAALDLIYAAVSASIAATITAAARVDVFTPKHWFQGLLFRGLGGDVKQETYWYGGIPGVDVVEVHNIFGVAPLSEIATLTATSAVARIFGEALLEAAGELSADGKQIVIAQCDLEEEGILVGLVQPDIEVGAADLTEAAELTAAGRQIAYAVAVLSEAGELLAQARVVVRAEALLSEAAELAATGRQVILAAATLAPVAVLSATAHKVIYGNCSISSQPILGHIVIAEPGTQLTEEGRLTATGKRVKVRNPHATVSAPDEPFATVQVIDRPQAYVVEVLSPWATFEVVP